MRSDVSEAFSVMTSVSGLEMVLFNSPDIANNGLVLFGADSANRLMVTSRAALDQAFEAPAPLALTEGLCASPNITADCRALYYLNVTADLSLWTVAVMRR